MDGLSNIHLYFKCIVYGIKLFCLPIDRSSLYVYWCINAGTAETDQYIIEQTSTLLKGEIVEYELDMEKVNCKICV